MPRDRDQKKPTGIVSSGVKLELTARKNPPKPINPEAWQKAAWAFYDTIGEYRYSVAWVGNLLSRVKLLVHQDGEPTSDTTALDVLARLFGGPDGQIEMLRQLGIHFTVAGDSYVVAEGQGEGVDDKWYVVAATEMKWTGTGWMVDKKKLDDALVIRLWKPHPMKHRASDAPTRAVLPILSEIDGLTKHVAAQIDSRLAGAGMLVLPSEISFASTGQTTTDGGVQVNPAASADEFLAVLGENMITPIENRESAAAVVPMILQASGEHLDKIQHLTFWSELDKQAIELRQEAIQRLALGMDMPPEILTGTADMNHWNSWQMEESQIKAHTEPLIKIITQSLTEGYLRPMLEAEGLSPEEAHTFELAADTSALRVRPNRSKEAIELWQAMLLKGEAVLRENGFEESDLMEEDERSEWLARRVASGSTTPELVESALRMLGVDLPTVQAAEIIEAEPTEARPQPSLKRHPVREIPEQPEADAAALAKALIAGQFQVLRALERAGNRMKTRHGSLPAGIAPPEAYLVYPELDAQAASALVADAWTYVDRVDCGLPVDFLQRELHAFTCRLIADRKRFDVTDLRDHLIAAARTAGLIL